MRVEGVINGIMAEILQFRGSFSYAGLNWHLVELETKVPNDTVEKQGAYLQRFSRSIVVLECDITMTACDCTGTIVCMEEVEKQFVLLDKSPIFLDGIAPLKRNSVVEYDLDITHITNKKWNSPMVLSEIMFAPQSGNVNRMQTALNQAKNGLYIIPQFYEGTQAYTIEDAILKDVLNEFNSQIICGTRISNMTNDVELLELYTDKLMEDTGNYTKFVVHNYKGVGYGLPNPTKVTIKKVGAYYFTRAEYVHRYDSNDRQIDVYGHLVSSADRRNYTKEKAEAV
jgi:hypothetical protein